MNILQVYQVFNPEVASGAAQVAYDISKSLVKRGHKVIFYSSDMEDWLSRGLCGSSVVDGITIYRLKTVGTMLSRKLKIYITPSLMAIPSIEIQKFDIIRLHGYRSFQNVVIAHHARRHGVPYVLRARKRTLREADRVITINRALKDYTVKMGLRKA